MFSPTFRATLVALVLGPSLALAASEHPPLADDAEPPVTEVAPADPS